METPTYATKLDPRKAIHVFTEEERARYTAALSWDLQAAIAEHDVQPPETKEDKYRKA